VTTQKPKKQLLKTTNICKTKPIETKAWFRSSFTPSGQETDRDYSYSAAPGATMDLCRIHVMPWVFMKYLNHSHLRARAAIWSKLYICQLSHLHPLWLQCYHANKTVPTRQNKDFITALTYQSQ